MSNMEHELTCCVCLELYEKPLLLPCSHNFCRKCILGLVQYNSGQGAMRRSFSCPKCRREIYLEGSRMRGVDCLPINQVLDNIVKVYKTQSNISSTRPSKLCSTHSQPQTSYCHTCKKLVCYECIQLTHSGFGHVVKDSADFIDEEKSKIQQSLHELTTFKSEMKVRRQSLEQFIKDAKSHETTMHKTNEDEIQQLVSALVLRKQQLNRAIFTRYQTTIRPAEMLKNKFFYVESEASKLEKEFDHILDEKDDARKIRLLQMFHTRLSSFLTFKAGSIEELPEEVYLPRLQWENLDSVRDTISAIKWSDDSPQGKLQADSGLHKRLAVRSFSLPASEEVDVGRFMRQVYDTSDQHQSSSSLPTCSPSILSAGSSAMSSPALPSSPSHCLAAVPTSSAMLSFKNVFSSVAAKLQCGNPALAGATSLSRGSSPECRSPVPFSPASKSPSLKKKTTMGEHSAHARGDAHAQQNVFNFSFVSSENKACAASQTLNGGSPRMSSASTQTLANNNMPEPEQVDKDNEENEGKNVKKRERRPDVRSVQSEAWQGENPQNVSFQPLKLDFSVRPKVYTKGDASKFKSSAKHSVKSAGNQLEKSLADLHKMWGNFKVGETHDGTDSRDSLRQQSTEPSVSHGFHFTPSDSRKVDQSKTNFNFASSEAEGDTPGPSALFVFGQPAEGENIPRTTATKDSVIRSNGPSSSSQKDAPSGCSNCHPDLSRKEPLPSTSKSAVLSFYFDKKSACDKKSDSNANLNDNGNESMHSPKLKKSMKSLSKSQEKMQNGMNPRMAASLRVGISSSGPRDDARRVEDATFNVKEERGLGAEATKVAAESSGLDGQVQGEHAEASSAVFSLGCHPSFSMGKGSSQNKQGSPTNKRTIKKLCRRK